jgi:hypothetical protein
LRTDLVAEALSDAVNRRRPTAGVVFHSDSETVAASFPGFLTLTAMDTSGWLVSGAPRAS